MYLPLATWPPGSVTVTLVPEVFDGTLRVQLKAPVALVVSEPLVQLVTETPSNTNRTVLEAENPVPVIVTVAPGAPWLALRAIAGTVTVNEPTADCPPTSVAVTVVPEVCAGTLTVQPKVPPAPVANEPAAQLETVTPSKTSRTGLRTEKPVPDTVTVAPTGPWAGLTVIRGVVTVNLAVPCWPPASVTATVVEEVPLGTLNEHTNSPRLEVVSEPAVQAETFTPSNTRPTGLDTENPAPASTTAAPIGP